MNSEKKHLDILHQFREDIENWFFSDYSGFKYNLEVETEYEDEIRWNIDIIAYDDKICTLYFRYDNDRVEVNRYEDVYEEFTEVEFYKQLFFECLSEVRKK